MRNLFPKITAIVLGAVFLLGGATTAFGAEFYHYKENSGGGSAPVQVGGPFADKPSCQAAQQAKEKETTTFGSPKYRTTSFCHAGTSLAAEQAIAAGQTTANQNQQNVADNATGENLTEEQKQERALLSRLNCGISITDAGKDNLVDCIPKFVYYAIYKPTSYLLAGSGYILDVMLTLSIDSQFVNQTFVADSWTVVRDFSNMLFIFILLYVGVQTILGMGDWRKTVLMVIVMALLINFSLFFTKVVIDAGNVLAVGIYSSMSTPKAPEKQNIISGGVPERSISGSMAGAFAPQKFLKVSGDVMALDATIVFIIATIVSGFAAYVFFKAALIFVGRLIAFWFLMIVSPFAFISLALPGKANKFQGWLDLLLAQAFVAPVFLFMVYMIMKVISSGNGILEGMIKQPTATASFTFDKVLAPVIVATLIIIALQKALEYAESMADDFGKLGSGIMGSVMGIAAGAATGGASLVGRAAGGRLAQGLYERGTFAKMATNPEGNAASRMVGRSLIGLNEKARTGTWDARGIGAVQQAAKMGGIAHLGKPGEGAKGGFEGAMKRQDQADKKFAEKLKMTSVEKETIEKQVTEKTKEVDHVISEKRAAATAAAEKVTSAQASVNNARNAGKLDPGLSKVLKAAEEEKEKADNALAEAEKETVETAEKLIEKAEDERRKSYAEFVEQRGKIIGTAAGAAGMAGMVAGGVVAGPLGAAAGYAAGIAAAGKSYSNEQARRTAEKLRVKGGKEAKPSDEGKELKDLVKKLKAEMSKE